MHLTLKFLGEVPDSEIMRVCQITEQTAARHRPFDLDIEGVGHFGGRSARVVWVGTGHGCQELAAMQNDLEQTLDTAGWARDARRFSAHLTLGRIKNSQAGFALARAVQEYKDLFFGTTAIKEIIVYESQLTPQGPIYTAAGRYAL
jgi:2'-5' RNA ligase